MDKAFKCKSSKKNTRINENEKSNQNERVRQRNYQETQENINYLMGAIPLKPSNELQKIINNGTLQEAKLALTEINEKLKDTNLSANAIVN